MSKKILRRCDICGRYHVAYRLPVENGKVRNYCYDCWKARFNPSLPRAADKDEVSPNSLDLEKDSK